MRILLARARGLRSLRGQVPYPLSGMNAQFLEDPAHVGGHGALGDAELRCDPAIGEPASDELRDLPLAMGERIGWFAESRFVGRFVSRRRGWPLFGEGVPCGFICGHRPPLFPSCIEGFLAELGSDLGQPTFVVRSSASEGWEFYGGSLAYALRGCPQPGGANRVTP